MKKLIVVAIAVLLLAAFFENVRFTVQGAGGPVPYAYVKLGNAGKLTDINGKTDIVKTIFQNSVGVERLGFKSITVYLPFSLFYLNYHIGLVVEDYNGITKQLNKMLSDLSSYQYSYTLRVSQGESVQSQTISAKFDKGEFSFSNKSDFTGTDYTVVYKNKNFYLIKDGERNILEGEEKDSFISKNIVFLSAYEIVSSMLPGETPQRIDCKGNAISIVWSNAKAVLTVGSDGMLSEIDFTQKTENESIEVHFTLSNVNEKVEI